MTIRSSSKRRRVQPPEIRRTQILEAAKCCFRRSGFHGTQIAAIAEEADISVGLLYRYFPGKDALIEAIAREDMLAQQRVFVDALSHDADDPAAALERLLQALISSMFDDERTALMLEITHQTVRSPNIRAIAKEMQDDVAQLIRSRLQISPATTPQALSARLEVLGGLMSGTAIRCYGRSDAPDPAVLALLKQTVRQLLLAPGDTQV